MQPVHAHKYSAGGLVFHEGKVLVIHSVLRGSTDFPKGTIEEGETIHDAATREVQEETGYRVSITKDLGSITYDFDGRDGNRYRKTVSYFQMELADDGEPVKNLQESEDFENEWLTPEEALHQLSYDDTRTLLRNTLKDM